MNKEEQTMKEPRFYKCAHCGNIITKVEDKGVPVFCCGQKMDELVPGSIDASHEKHVPAVNVGEGLVEVNVGSVNHPMEEVHWIEWVQLVSDKGSYRKWLNPGEAPHVKFLLHEEKPLAVYAYCNLHGLWKKEL
jgi:superoxide reductase